MIRIKLKGISSRKIAAIVAAAVVIICIYGVYTLYYVPSATQPTANEKKGKGHKPASPTNATEEEVWITVKNFTGTGDAKNETFYISRDKFKVKWRVQAESNNETVGFSLRVYNESGAQVASRSFSRSGSDAIQIYEGPGNFYLEIVTNNVKEWTIEILEPPS